MTGLLIARHGRTEWNAVGRVQGQLDAQLDEQGRAEAGALTSRLAALGPVAIASSDLSRAAETAACLAELTGLEVRLDPRLRERCFGAWQGLLNEEIQERYPEAYATWKLTSHVDGFGVELVDDVAKRTAAAFLDAAELAPGATVAVFGHGASIKYGLATLLGWTDGRRALGSLHNCHWVDLRRDPVRGWQLARYNIT